MVLHAHHSASPLTTRARPKKHPLLGLTDLLSWCVDATHMSQRLTHQHVTVVWADIKEDKKAKERVATVGVVLEGLVRIKAGADTGDEAYDPYYGHLSVWVMRKPANGTWQVQFVASGLPPEQAGVGARTYKRKLHSKSKIGPKKKSLKHFQDMHRDLHAKGKKAEFDQAWDDAIPPGPDTRTLRDDWSARTHQGVDLWDLLGWDISVNGRGC